MHSSSNHDYSQSIENISTEIEETFEIFEEKPDHHFRTELPNIIFELGLTVYDRAVYSELKRVAGDKGKCWKSYKNIATFIGISETQVKKSIKILEGNFEKLGNIPLIKVTQRFKEKQQLSNLIQIVPIWRQNGDYFRKGGGSQYAPPLGRNTPPPGSPRAYEQDPIEEDLLKTTVVVFSDEEKKKCEAMKGIPISEKTRNKFIIEKTIEQIENAKKTWIEEGPIPAAFFTAALNAGWTPNDRLDPMKIIRDNFKNGKRYNHAECFLDDTGIAFQRGMLHGQVKFGEKGLTAKFEALLDKFGIVV